MRGRPGINTFGSASKSLVWFLYEIREQEILCLFQPSAVGSTVISGVSGVDVGGSGVGSTVFVCVGSGVLV